MPPFHNKNTKMTEELFIQKCGIYALQDYPKYLSERYSNICNFAKQNDFDIIVIFQPTLMFTKRLKYLISCLVNLILR